MQIEIFRPGKFTSMEGIGVQISPADLQAIADAYDPASDAPVVVGHPDHDAPAYGWVKGLRYDAAGERLLADIGDLSPSFAAAVKAKNYKKISASLFEPNSPANPKPGQYYLRHIGFLGGAAPGVPGLKTVHFAARARGTKTFEFAAPDAGDEKGKKMSITDALKSVVAKVLGDEAANTLFASDEMKDAEAELEKSKAEAAAAEAAAAPKPEEKPADAGEGDNSGETEEERKKREAAGAASFAAMRRREADLAKREAALRESARRELRRADVSFCDEMIKAGKLLPAQRADVLRSLEAMIPAGNNVSFSDGSEGNPREALKKAIRSAPARVNFSEGLPSEEKPAKPSFDAPDGYAVDENNLDLYSQAKKYQAEHPEIAWADAVKAVGG